mgnify:CR=1 FL=1
MEIVEFFHKELIVTNVNVKSNEEIFKILFKKLYDRGFVKKSFLDAIIEREKTFPTGLSLNKYNVAIPHTDPKHVIKPAVAVATLKKPVVFKNMGDPLESVNVSIVFMIALNQSHSQVEALQQMIQLIQNDRLLEKMINSKGGDEINGDEIISSIKKNFIDQCADI